MAFESFAKVRRDPTFRDLARDNALNEPDVEQRVRDEADGTATWARWEPSLTGFKGDMALQIDLGLAVTNALALT